MNKFSHNVPLVNAQRVRTMQKAKLVTYKSAAVYCCYIYVYSILAKWATMKRIYSDTHFRLNKVNLSAKLLKSNKTKTSANKNERTTSTIEWKKKNLRKESSYTQRFNSMERVFLFILVYNVCCLNFVCRPKAFLEGVICSANFHILLSL